MRSLAKFINQYALWILGSAVVLSFGLAPGIGRLEIARGLDNDNVTEFNELVRSVKTLRKEFSANMRQVIVSIETKGDQKITDPQVLKLVKGLSSAIVSVPTVKKETLLSLDTVKEFHSDNDSLGSEPLINSIPTDSKSVKDLENRIAANPFYYGKLISKDFHSALMMVAARDDVDLKDIHTQVEAALKPLRQQIPGVVVTLMGDPEINYQLFTSIEREAILFAFISLIVVFLSFFLIFKTWQGILLPLVGVFFGVIWTMGLMGYYGEPILILSACLPVILVVIGSSYIIHVYEHLQKETSRGLSFTKALEHTFKQLMSPLSMSTITTVIGALSLLMFKIEPIRHFGLFMAIGAAFLFIVTILVVPTLFKLLHKPADNVEHSLAVGLSAMRGAALKTIEMVPLAGPVTSTLAESLESSVKGGLKGAWIGFWKGANINSLLDRGLRGIARWSTRFPLRVLGAVTIILGLSAFYAQKIQVGYNNISMLPQESPIRGAVQRLDTAFGGTQRFEIMVDSAKADGALAPAFLARVENFENEALKIEKVSYSFSVLHVLKKINSLLDPSAGMSMPKTREALVQYLFILGMSDSGVPLDQLITSDNQKLRIMLTVNTHDTHDAKLIYGQLKDLAKTNFGDDAEVTIGGDLVGSVALMSYLVMGKIQNILASALCIFLLIILTSRSLVRGFLTSLALPIGCLLNFGLMGLVGIRLDYISAIITSVAMGLGVDFSIHFVSALMKSFRETKNISKSIEKAILGPGKVLVCGAASTLLGFAVLFVSRFPAIQNFAILMCFSLAMLLLSALLILPAVIRLFPPEFITGYRRRHKLVEPRRSLAMKWVFSTVVIGALVTGIVFLDMKSAKAASNEELSAAQILDKGIRHIYGGHEESVFVMRLVRADGKEAPPRKMKIWFKKQGEDKAKLLLKFMEPADIRGTGLLTHMEKGKGMDQWLYLPALKKVRRITGGNGNESFLGSDFTVGDFSVGKEFQYDYSLEASIKCGEFQCYVLSGKPRADLVGSLPYSKKVLHIRKDNFLTVTTEYYNEGAKLEKVMSLGKVHKVGENWVADEMEMKNLLKGSRTVIQVEKRDTTKVPSDSMFTQSNLERN